MVKNIPIINLDRAKTEKKALKNSKTLCSIHCYKAHGSQWNHKYFNLE